MVPVANPEDEAASPTLAPPTQQIFDEGIPANDMYDPSWRTDSSEEEFDEGLVPDSESSDTDVDGVFDCCPSTAVGQPIPSPGIVGMQDPPVAGNDNVPFWSGISHFTNVNWEYPDQELDDMNGAQIPNWHIGDELYKDQLFDTKQDVQMAYHVYCLRHVASNFNHKFKNVMLKKQLKKLGYTTSRLDFDAGLEKFKETSPQIAAWIDHIPKEKWSISYDEQGRRFGHMTTNLSECVNKVLKWARNLPITSLVRITYSRLVAYFLEHGQKACDELERGNLFAKVMWRAYVDNQRKAATHCVTSYDAQRTRFEVQESYNVWSHRDGKKWSVSLSERTCQCGEFTSFRFPCSHVIAACTSTHHDPTQYIDPAYSAKNQCEVYSAQWYPIGNEDFIPPFAHATIIPEVSMRRQWGRPNSTRIHNEMDSREGAITRTRCGYCREVGHNKRHCPSRQQPQQ
ncbi:uncharacterized protein LOC133286996 [Gastrolobium bilobum]|uniref:uncharacterized protein LOC133286996 n=1 Tax=Gastrolobium bilobum TaxID=150636 RepID=UPI002AB2061C|nr:uncharacterized protein LOC133286996 [Gastrolobium bilobum]